MHEWPDQKVEVVLLPEALKRADQVIETNRINVDDFRDLYHDEGIKEDNRRLEEREMKINDLFREESQGHEGEARHNLELSKVFHGVVLNNPTWFGMPTNTRTYATSRFDDVFHGVDIIVEKVSPGQGSTELGLGIDVTFGRNIEVLKRKIEKIKNTLIKGS